MSTVQQTTTTTTSTIGFHPEYLRTIPGILKCVELLLAVLTYICAVVKWYFSARYGGGWVQFVAISAFAITLTLLLLHIFSIWPRIVSLKPRIMAPVLLSLLTFICACVVNWSGSGVWTRFVSISAFLTTMIDLLLHLLNLISRFPGPWLLIEFIYYCLYTLFFFIAACVCAAKAELHSSIAAATFFAFAATAVFAVDSFFQYRAWRSGMTEMSTTTHTTQTSTTVTTVQSKEQY